MAAYMKMFRFRFLKVTRNCQRTTPALFQNTCQSRDQIVVSRFNYRNTKNRWRKNLLPVGCILGISFFSKKTEETEEEKKEAENDEEEEENEVNDTGHLSNPVILYIKKGKIAAANGSFKEAQMNYHAALRLSQDQLKQKKIDEKKHLGAVVYIYDAMANLALSQKDYEKAFVLFRETISCCLEQGVEETSNAIVEISIKMATIYALTGNDEEARIGFEHCIKVQEEKLLKESDEDSVALLGMVEQTYGRYLLTKKEYENAENHLKQASAIAHLNFADQPQKHISLLNDIATVQVYREKYDEGEATLMKAAEIAEPKKMYDLPAIYSNLGAIALRLSKLDEAHERCEKALNFAQSMKQKTAEKESLNCLEKVKEARKKGK